MKSSSSSSSTKKSTTTATTRGRRRCRTIPRKLSKLLKKRKWTRTNSCRVGAATAASAAVAAATTTTPTRIARSTAAIITTTKTRTRQENSVSSFTTNNLPSTTTTAAAVEGVTTTPPRNGGVHHRHIGRDDVDAGGGGDKYEISPNNLAKCRTCRHKIVQGETRVGLEGWEDRYQKWIHRYYHERCFPASAVSKLRLVSGRSPELELEHQQKSSIQRQHLLTQRSHLRDALRQLRLEFSRRLRCAPFIVFSDKTLDDLAIRLPRNSTELLEVHGIGPKRIKNFGDSILYCIHLYGSSRGVTYQQPNVAITNKDHLIRNSINVGRNRLQQGTATLRRLGKERRNNNADDKDDHDIEIGPSLTCEELVNQKFQHAQANGYIISIDGIDDD